MVDTTPRHRILIAKPGLDGHDRGAKVIARALRDAGMEVIYTGLHQTPEMIVRSAIQEDVQAIGMSILSGRTYDSISGSPRDSQKEGAGDIVLFGGGIVPKEDVIALKKIGVSEVFLPGASTQSVVDWIRTNVKIAQ